MTPRFLARLPRPFCAIVALCAAVAACGGAPASPQAPASSAAPLAGGPLGPAANLSPVPPPPGLVVSGRLTRLEASLGVVHGWTQLPMPRSEQVTEMIAGEGLGALVDLGQPIDFAVAISGAGAGIRSLVAVSAALRDFDQAKAALGERYKLVQGADGALLIQGVGRGAHSADEGDDGKSSDDGDDPHACELAPAFGPAPTRLVCGLDAKALSALGPWLTRGATRLTSTSDAHVEVHVDPLKPTIAAERRLLSVLLGTVLGKRLGLSGARDLAQAVGGDLADFANDLDGLSLDVVLSDPGAAATATLTLSGTSSALARLATANADRNGPPPAAFWQMPGDADYAVFTRGIDPSFLARARDLALKWVDDDLAEDGLKDADRHAVTDALGKIASSAPVVYASGIDADAAGKAMAAEQGLGDGASADARREASRASAQALLGWRVIEIDEPAAGRVDAMKGLVMAFARPGVEAAFRGKGGGPSPKVAVARVPKDAGLPKDAQAFEIDLPMPLPQAPAGTAGKGAAKPAAPGKPLAIGVFIVPDGARSWIGVGAVPLVTSKLSAALGGSGDTLNTKPELASLKDANLGTGGFVTARGVPEAGEQATALWERDRGGFGHEPELFEAAAQLPHLGMTPVPFSMTAQPGTPTALVMTLQVARGTIDDVLVMALKHGF